MSPDHPALTGERQRSLWQSTAGTLSLPALAGDAEAEVCIVGAGIAGLSVAYELTLAGRSVIVWTGQVFEPVDGMAFIGRNPHDADNVYIVTGDSGNGLTHGTIAGLVLSSLILGKPHPWAGLYDPRRITMRTAPAFLQENLNVAAQYRDHLTGGDWESADAIPPGCGGIVREGLHKLAVFRDDDGDLHRCSAVCPHLKCIVHWNSVERTWDCPCHGSRFDALGKVLTGPAIRDLPLTEENPDDPRDLIGPDRAMVPA